MKRLWSCFTDDMDHCYFTGTAPVEQMQGYLSEVNAYTRGCGRLSLELSGYEPVDESRQEELVAKIGQVEFCEEMKA